MPFNSFLFAVFFLALYGAYLLTMRRLRMQNALLLVGSYVFYGWWDWRFLSLIAISTLVDYYCSLALDQPPHGDHGTQTPAPRSPAARRALLCLSIAVNLGILGLFKYYDFFADSAAALLDSLGLQLQPRLLKVILPVGISFYTFQTMSYTIDVYRNRLRATRSLLDFAVFVSFFPQLVAGPIVRAADFLPQVSQRRHLKTAQVYEGCYLVLWGLFKKVVIADNLGQLVDRVFTTDDPLLGGAVLVALYAFAIQIYCDFSGYSDIARGVAKMMGFELRLNFHLPYFATNPQAFWQRWHISLSTWLRDYLYLPLGGNRKGRRRTCINVMVVMMLGGLWHGAAWTFVLWGLYQGAVLVAHRAAMPTIERWSASWSPRRRWVATACAAVAFFHVTCLGWLIFRAESVAQIGEMLKLIVTSWPWWILVGAIKHPWHETGALVLLFYTAPLLIMQIAQRIRGDLNMLLRLPAPVRGLAYTLMFYGIVLFGGYSDQPFIYFQF